MERLLCRSHRLSNVSVSSQEVLVPLRTLESSAQSIWCTHIWPEHCVPGSVLITGSFLSLLFNLLHYSCILQNPFLVRGLVKRFSGLIKARQALYWSLSGHFWLPWSLCSPALQEHGAPVWRRGVCSLGPQSSQGVKGGSEDFLCVRFLYFTLKGDIGANVNPKLEGTLLSQT